MIGMGGMRAPGTWCWMVGSTSILHFTWTGSLQETSVAPQSVAYLADYGFSARGRRPDRPPPCSAAVDTPRFAGRRQDADDQRTAVLHRNGGIVSATPKDVETALSNVIDPELGIDVVNLGLIYEVTVDDGVVRVVYTLTAPACPLGSQIEAQIVEYASVLAGVTVVRPELTFTPAWSTDRMSADAKFALGME